MFGRRRKILARGERVYIFMPTRDTADDFLAFTRANQDFHRPWVYPAIDADSYRAYLDRLESTGARGFLIARNADDMMVGVINVNDVIMGGFCSGSLGYYGSGAVARRGYMAEALALVLEQAFETMGMHRIEANVQPGNSASLALVARVGFRKEGFSPSFLQIDGKWCDHERWAILADEWRRRLADRSRRLSTVV
jgi:ribosomal-protein-alanine N-acetyltransferase